MLMFVFGAGASFDSDPNRRPDDPDLFTSDHAYRPPLAPGLFDPQSRRGKEAVAAFPRAASVIMQLRQATAQQLDVEEVLEQIALGEADYPETRTQLLAFRAYLARLLTQVPEEWTDECQGLTNYVLALAQSDRWNVNVHGPDPDHPVGCVTFNYDTLLEQAALRVFGYDIDDMDAYSGHPRIHVHKPHGSIDWRTAAKWDKGPNQWMQGVGGLFHAIQQAPSLEWTDRWARIADEDLYQDPSDATHVWLPALSIPVRSKSEFTMPPWHREAMVRDLNHCSTVIAVGWRARERHFLNLLQDELPSQPSRLVAVGPNVADAMETVNNLWETGRFERYAISTLGFSGFTETPTQPYSVRAAVDRTQVCLQDVLSAGENTGFWSKKAPGTGLTPEAEPAVLLNPGYVDL